MDKKLKILPTPLSGLYIIEPNSFIDERGSFSRVYCEDELAELVGVEIKQINHSITKQKGSVRGLHFQYEPDAELKMVKCIRGSVFDVVVDIRKKSPTFLQHFSLELSEENQKMILIPKGFAHGFQTLEDDTQLLYLHSSVYSPQNEGALHVNDPHLGIKWPMKMKNLSQRDTKHTFIDESFEGIEIDEM